MYLMTPDEAAKELKVSPETLRRWLRRGEFKAAKTPAGWRISEQDMMQFLAARHTGQPDSNDDDADLVAAAEATLDRIARGEERTTTLEQWEQRHGLGS
jgi:excisionase family DNA binding protein